MSKGRKPKKDNLPTVTTRDVADGDGGGGVEDSVDTCWDFALVEKTAAANTVKEGTAAIGSIQGQLVLVRANAKPLGYAPSDVSQFMITAARERGARLSGSVTSPGKKGVDVWVKLCLKD
jgi:hypothetical protein